MTIPVQIPHLTSKLPNIGTTIFSVMSVLAQQHHAVNLGQGFPDFDCDPGLIEAVHAAMLDGHNQYPPMAGIPALRHALHDKLKKLYGHSYDADTEITITAGATQALTTAIICAIHPGDDVLVIEPAFDSYIPAIRLAGGAPLCVQMRDDYTIDWELVRETITPKTRAIILNSPHNPSGRVLSDTDFQILKAIVLDHNLLVISDEVYEHILFDGQKHRSVASDPDLASRSFMISSFGKTYHVTGWKVGYVAAPAPLMSEFRKIHQFNVFSVNPAMQCGLAAYMQLAPHYLELSGFYQKKRDLFRQGLAQTKFKLLPCEGTYFQLADYSEISDLPEEEFARWLTIEHGVAVIPLSVFYTKPLERKHIRFCFAKREDTLLNSLERLATA